MFATWRRLSRSIQSLGPYIVFRDMRFRTARTLQETPFRFPVEHSKTTERKRGDPQTTPSNSELIALAVRMNFLVGSRYSSADDQQSQDWQKSARRRRGRLFYNFYNVYYWLSTLPANAADAATDTAAASAIFFMLILQSFACHLWGKVVRPHDIHQRLYLVLRFKQQRITTATGSSPRLSTQNANVVN